MFILNQNKFTTRGKKEKYSIFLEYRIYDVNCLIGMK